MIYRAILTKYVGPTNYKPSRIIASDEAGNRVIISRDFESDIDENHARAALLLANSKWGHKRDGSNRYTIEDFAQGAIKNGYAFCLK